MAKKTKFEIAVIDKVKQMRMKKKLTQSDLAEFIGSSRGFVGQVESPTYAAKYNLNHLNILAQEMGCSPKDFMPEKSVVDQGRSKKKK